MMHKFFIENRKNTGDLVCLDGNDYNHLKNSLRLNIGDRVILSDADGFDMLAEIKDISDTSAELLILDKEKSDVEAELDIWLAQGLPKKRKMDLVVEKATEIGFKGLIPLETDRSVVKYNDSKKEKKRKRWERVAEAAAKQSGRAVIPKIYKFFKPEALKDLKDKFDHIIVLWEDEKKKSLKSFFRMNKVSRSNSILIIVGPEGGFSEKEIKVFSEILSANFITLGPRILRTETAGITALSCILYEKGELGD